MSERKDNLDGFLSGKYGDHPTTVVEVAQGDPSPFIVIRHGRFAVVVNPLALGDHLSVDIHPFVDGQDATAAAFGMTNGRRVSLPETGSTSHGWSSTAMVAVLVGEQSHGECEGHPAGPSDPMGATVYCDGTCR